MEDGIPEILSGATLQSNCKEFELCVHETGTICSIQGFHENTTKKLSIHESWPFLKRFWMTLQCTYMSCSTMCSTQVGTTLVLQVSVGSYISSVFHTKSEHLGHSSEVSNSGRSILRKCPCTILKHSSLLMKLAVTGVLLCAAIWLCPTGETSHL